MFHMFQQKTNWTSEPFRLDCVTHSCTSPTGFVIVFLCTVGEDSSSRSCKHRLKKDLEKDIVKRMAKRHRGKKTELIAQAICTSGSILFMPYCYHAMVFSRHVTHYRAIYDSFRIQDLCLYIHLDLRWPCVFCHTMTFLRSFILWRGPQKSQHVVFASQPAWEWQPPTTSKIKSNDINLHGQRIFRTRFFLYVFEWYLQLFDIV